LLKRPPDVGHDVLCSSCCFAIPKGWNLRALDAQRIAAARRFIPDFGVASECGWGRTDPSRLPGLLASHREAAAALP
jgi:hypothetical protein